MHFLKTLLTFSSVFLVAAAVPESQKDNVLSSISAVSDAVQANKDAINRYQGGQLSAITVGRKNYDCWLSLREAHANLTNTKFTPKESDEVVRHFSSLNQGSIELLNSYREKAPVLNQAGVSFLVPIMMEALFREADDYAGALQALAPEKDVASLKQIRADHTTAWNAAFEAYDPTRNSEPTEQFKTLFSVFSPALNYVL